MGAEVDSMSFIARGVYRADRQYQLYNAVIHPVTRAEYYYVNNTATTGSPLPVEPNTATLYWMKYGDPGTAEWDAIEQRLATIGSASLDARMDAQDAVVSGHTTLLGTHTDGIAANASQLAEITNSYVRSNSGIGTDADPYTDTDGTAGISSVANSLNVGGKVTIPVGRYSVTTPIEIEKGNVAIVGDVWGYNEDPNGVWGIKNGTRIKLANGINGIVVDSAAGSPSYRNGCSFKDFGIQGQVENSNTAELLDYSNPAHAGVALLSGRVDQCNFEHISLCGLGAAIYIKSGMNVDACMFDWINGGGCNVGLLMLSAVTYYTTFKDCLFSDCPGHGVIVNSAATNLVFDNLKLVRNGGGLSSAQKAVYSAASLYFAQAQYCVIRNCFINDSGQWSEYFTNGTGGNPGTVNNRYDTDTVGIYFAANNNDVYNNVVRGGQSNALVLTGAGNKFRGNLYRTLKKVLISGNSNHLFDEQYDLATGTTETYALEVTGSYNVFDNCRYSKPIHITGTGNIFNFCNPSASIAGAQIVIDGNSNTIRGISAGLVTNNGSGNVIA
jgi:hypothetical protein